MGMRIDVEAVGIKMRISIAGELLAEGVRELEKASEANGDTLELDLSDLSLADFSGVEALRRPQRCCSGPFTCCTVGWISTNCSGFQNKR